MRHERETGIGKDRAGLKHVPRAYGHRRRADAEDRARAIAEDEGGSGIGIDTELFDAPEDSDPSFRVGHRPACGKRPTCLRCPLEPAGLDPRRRGIEEEQWRVARDDLAEAGHLRLTKRRGAAVCKHPLMWN